MKIKNALEIAKEVIKNKLSGGTKIRLLAAAVFDAKKIIKNTKTKEAKKWLQRYAGEE